MDLDREYRRAETLVVLGAAIGAAALAYFAFGNFWAAGLFGLIMFILFDQVGAYTKRLAKQDQKLDRILELLENNRDS